MINYNGSIIENKALPTSEIIRATKYGDAIFETMRFREGKVLFIEDHYFRMMASMRILRMGIPHEFTPEFIVNEVVKLADDLKVANGRVRFQVCRAGEGMYTPLTNDSVNWWIELEKLESQDYPIYERGLVVDLFKDHYVQPGLLSTLKSANSLLYVLSGIFAKENGLDQMILVNDQKMVVESNLGNLFVLEGNVLKTPPLLSGALRGVFRKNLLEWAKELHLEVEECDINPFSLQKADEIWVTNTIKGVQWVEQYRKKQYAGTKATEMQSLLNRRLNVLGSL